jgi:hypothetical protein
MFDQHPSCASVTILDREAAKVEVSPPRKKVAIIGFATNTLHLVPWVDPEFELWGLNQGYAHMLRRADRWFEMHLPEYTEDARDPKYREVLQKIGIPVYMPEIAADVPTSVRYPIEAVIGLTPKRRDYFTSSISFMIALAVLEGFEAIHLYGINLAIGSEYEYEKPCAEYWCGFCEGRGIDLFVPRASALLKQYKRYGYNPEPVPGMLTRQLLVNRQNMYRSECEQLLNQYHMKLGALREGEALAQAIEGAQHGADIVLPVTQALPPTSTSS